MKKWIAAILLLLLAAFIALYLLLPGQRKVSNAVVLKANNKGILRQLANKASWNKWWPRFQTNDSHTLKSTGPFIYNSHEYTLLSVASNSIDIGIRRGSDTLISTLLVAPLGFDSVLLDWQYVLQEKSWNPIKRNQLQNREVALQESLEPVFERLWKHIQEPENLYGIRVQQHKITDTLLISTKAVFNHEPTTAEVYGMIHQLENYCTQQGAQQTGTPMLNIRRDNSTQTEVMVAIPVNKQLPNQGNIAIKRMIPGNVLITEITGGPHRIKEAFAQMKLYIDDYGYQPPVIPFESLITDRSKETDTTKWVTKIYFPVL